MKASSDSQGLPSALHFPVQNAESAREVPATFATTVWATTVVVAAAQVEADTSHGSTEDGVDEQETILVESPAMSIADSELIMVTEPGNRASSGM